jgi:hypothetical protein
MPLAPLGIFAKPAAAGGSFESIATANGTGSANTITFSSIPSTYTHLQIRGIGQNTGAAAASQYAKISFNSDTTTSNYRWHDLEGDGASASSNTDNTLLFLFQRFPRAGFTNIYGAFIIDILDYTNTNKYKTSRALSGFDTNTSQGGIYFQSALWMSTSAISSITFTTGADNWSSGTTFALYGIKSA